MKPAHIAKPTPGIKMPMPKVHKAAPTPKAHVPRAAPAKVAKVPTAKVPTGIPALKLPTIPEHREKLAGMASTPKKGKQS